jgi:hypothetical protein
LEKYFQEIETAQRKDARKMYKILWGKVRSFEAVSYLLLQPQKRFDMKTQINTTNASNDLPSAIEATFSPAIPDGSSWFITLDGTVSLAQGEVRDGRGATIFAELPIGNPDELAPTYTLFVVPSGDPRMRYGIVSSSGGLVVVDNLDILPPMPPQTVFNAVESPALVNTGSTNSNTRPVAGAIPTVKSENTKEKAKTKR